MKKGFAGFVLGLIVGIVGIVAGISVIFKKLKMVDGFVEKIKDTIFDGIHNLLYGPYKKPVGYVSYSKYSSPYNSYSSTFNYTNNVITRIMSKEFDTKEEADRKLTKIKEELDMFGVITVERMLDILGADTKDSCRKYLDTKFEWDDSDFPYFRICNLRDDNNILRYYIVVTVPRAKKVGSREEKIV